MRQSDLKKIVLREPEVLIGLFVLTCMAVGQNVTTAYVCRWGGIWTRFGVTSNTSWGCCFDVDLTATRGFMAKDTSHGTWKNYSGQLRGFSEKKNIWDQHYMKITRALITRRFVIYRHLSKTCSGRIYEKEGKSYSIITSWIKEWACSLSLTFKQQIRMLGNLKSSVTTNDNRYW